MGKRFSLEDKYKLRKKKGTTRSKLRFYFHLLKHYYLEREVVWTSSGVLKYLKLSTIQSFVLSIMVDMVDHINWKQTSIATQQELTQLPLGVKVEGINIRRINIPNLKRQFSLFETNKNDPCVNTALSS